MKQQKERLRYPENEKRPSFASVLLNIIFYWMKTFKEYLMALTLLFALAIPVRMSGYEVYISTGHKCKGEYAQKDRFPVSSQHVDGMWCMPWNFRFNYLSDAELKQLVENFRSKQMVVEIEMRHLKKGGEEGEPLQLVRAIKAGAQVHTLMLYNEHSRQGSMLTQEDIDYARKRYGQKYRLITNIRTWNPQKNPQILKQLDGCSFEFNAGDSTLNTQKANRWKEVKEAVEWCLDNDKVIYLLTPPGHEEGMSAELIRTKFRSGYEKLLAYLGKELGEERLAKEKRVIFVPSNYNFEKRPVHLSPETDPNTVTGVCKYLIRQRERFN